MILCKCYYAVGCNLSPINNKKEEWLVFHTSSIENWDIMKDFGNNSLYNHSTIYSCLETIYNSARYLNAKFFCTPYKQFDEGVSFSHERLHDRST